MTMAVMAPVWVVSSAGTSIPKTAKTALIGDRVGVKSDSQISATATCGTAKGTTKMPRATRHLPTILSSPTAMAVPSTTCASTPKALSAIMM